MSKTSAGTAWELFAIMADDGETIKMIVAKNPYRPSVVDVTEQIAKLAVNEQQAESK